MATNLEIVESAGRGAYSILINFLKQSPSFSKLSKPTVKNKTENEFHMEGMIAINDASITVNVLVRRNDETNLIKYKVGGDTFDWTNIKVGLEDDLPSFKEELEPLLELIADSLNNHLN